MWLSNLRAHSAAVPLSIWIMADLEGFWQSQVASKLLNSEEDHSPVRRGTVRVVPQRKLQVISRPLLGHEYAWKKTAA